MKRFLASALLAASLGAAHAEDAAPDVTPAEARPALEVPSQRRGYALDQPEILVRQRLFGLAHGLSLLTAACLDLPAYAGQIEAAYAAWHAKQGKAIETIVHDLANYYFGPRAAEAAWPDLARALNLPDNIQPALKEVTLHAACASLPEAIGRPRYELDKLLNGSAAAEPEGTVVPDSVCLGFPCGDRQVPTFGKPAE